MNQTRPLYRDRSLQIVFGVTLMAVLGVASITPAFPRMREEWGLSPGEVALLITAFTLPGVLLAPFIGIMADRIGRKQLLVPSLFLFGVAGGAIALTSNFGVILGLRVLQGVGAAALGAINVTIIGDLFSGERRAAAMGLNASVLSVGVASYPAIGGALALLGARYPFLLSLVAIPLGVVVMTSLHNPEPRSRQSLKDYLGGTWQYLKRLKVAGLFAAGILTFVLLYGAWLAYLPIFLGDAPFNASPLVIGLILASVNVVSAIVASQLGRITQRFSAMSLVKAAYPVYAVSLAMIPLMPALGFFILPAMALGVAQAINLPSIQIEVAGLAPLEHRAAFMSVNTMMLRLGQTVGPLLMGLAYVYTSPDTAFFAAALLALLALPAAVALGTLAKGISGAQ